MKSSTKDLDQQQINIGTISSLAVFFLLLAYIIVTLLGFISLESPLDPIGDPYFTLMELLILIISPLILIVMTVINSYANADVKIFSRIALIFMIIMTAITSSVHFLILVISRQTEFANLAWTPLFFSFKWPSVAYILDILAWDWFFALSFLFASPVFKKDKIENIIRILMIISGSLSLIGILGIPLNNMQFRNIGIIGYALVSPIIFLLLSRIFKQKKI